MTKQEFWAVMESCHDGDTETYLASLEAAAIQLPTEELQIFRAYLSAYLEAAAECVWLDMACKVINGYVSDDTALYFALWVVAQGETFLVNALADPDSLAELPHIPFGDAEFELLMSLGAPEEEDFDEEALAEMDDLDGIGDIGMLAVGIPTAARCYCREEVTASVEYKNGDRYGGYDSFEDAMDDIPNILPRLIQRAEQEGFSWKSTY